MSYVEFFTKFEDMFSEDLIKRVLNVLAEDATSECFEKFVKDAVEKELEYVEGLEELHIHDQKQANKS